MGLHMSENNREGPLRKLRIAIDSGLKTLRRDGLVEFTNQFISFIKIGGRFKTYSDSRVDNDSRWNLIESHIDQDDKIAVDIGCAEGFFTRKLASKGLYTIGIDQRASLEKARSKTESMDNIEFRQMTIDPTNVVSVPRSDVTLFLTIIHWWHKSYESEAAEEMLRTISKKTDTLIFEPPGETVETNSVESSEYSSINEFWTAYLREVLGEDVHIDYLGMTPYRGGDRKDPIYALDTSNLVE